MKFYNHFLSLICSVFDAYSGVLFLKDNKNKNRYNLAGYFSLGDNKFAEYIEDSGKGVISWIIKNERPILISNFDRRTDTILDYYSGENKIEIKSLMGCPLDSKLGALCVDSKNKFSFTEKDQKILHHFSKIIFSLHNELYESKKLRIECDFYRSIQIIEGLKRDYQRWKDFLKSFLNTIVQSTGFKYCLLVARDEKGEGYYIEDWNIPIFSNENLMNRKFPIESGVVGWVFKHGRSLINSETKGKVILFDRNIKTKPFKSLICLPIVIYFKVRGVLVLADDRPHPVSNEKKEFLSLVVDQLALFLENLYLKNKLKKLT